MMQKGGFEPELTALQREVGILRQRVAELQRRTALNAGPEPARRLGAVEVTVSTREALLLEAERIAQVGS